MNQFQFKLLAALCMVIDHVGYVFFPDESIWRMIGRLSFPLFAWLVVQGERYTRDVLSYLGRLLMMAVITQPFYMALFGVRQLNILVTLAIGLSMIRLGRKYPTWRYLIWGLGVTIAFVVPMDAGAYGLCVMLLLSRWQSFTKLGYSLGWWGVWLSLHGLYAIAFEWSRPIQLWAAVTPLLLYAFNGERGARARWFYWFYPGHLALLLALRWTLRG